MSYWWKDWQVIYLPEYDEIIVFDKIDLYVITHDDFRFPARRMILGDLIQVSLGEL